jgi:hypothetical protein
VDPQLAAEYLWPVVSLHPGPLEDYNHLKDAECRRDTDTARLVLLLSLYGREPELCRELMAPVFERAEQRVSASALEMLPIVTATILVDPDRAVEWHSRVFPQLEPDALHMTPQPWHAMAAMLADSDEAAWRWARRMVYGSSLIDADDF